MFPYGLWAKLRTLAHAREGVQLAVHRNGAIEDTPDLAGGEPRRLGHRVDRAAELQDRVAHGVFEHGTLLCGVQLGTDECGGLGADGVLDDSLGAGHVGHGVTSLTVDGSAIGGFVYPVTPIRSLANNQDEPKNH